MPNVGLTGKRFIGKILKEPDPLQRGRYYVQVPELMPHIPESKGILFPNMIHPTRLSNSDNGTSGTNTPLRPGMNVQVEFTTDDILSGRIISVISDDQPKSDMNMGKVTGSEPSGKIVQLSSGGGKARGAGGVPDIIKSGLDMAPQLDKSMLTDLINSGNGFAQNILGGLKDKLGDSFGQLSQGFKDLAAGAGDMISDAVSSIEDNLSKLGEAFTPESLASFKDSLSGLSFDCFDGKAVKEQIANLTKEAESLKSIDTNQILTGIKDQTQNIAGKIGDKMPNIQNASAVLSNVKNPEDYLQMKKDLDLTLAKNEMLNQIKLGKLAGFADERTGLPNFSVDDVKSYLKDNPALQDKIDLATGYLNQTQMFNKKLTEWQQENAGNIVNVVRECDQAANYEYGDGTLKPKPEERDEQYTILTTPNGTGIYVNENTENDPNSVYVEYNKKDSTIRVDSSGVHISTNHNMFNRVEANSDTEVNGTMSIVINGGEFDIYSTGNINLKTEGWFNVFASQGISLMTPNSTSIIAKKNIGLQAKADILSYCEGNNESRALQHITQKAGKSMTVQTGTGIGLTSDQDVHFYSSGDIYIDANTKINLNGGGATKIEGEGLQPGGWPKANPSKRKVSKV